MTFALNSIHTLTHTTYIVHQQVQIIPFTVYFIDKMCTHTHVHIHKAAVQSPYFNLILPLLDSLRFCRTRPKAVQVGQCVWYPWQQSPYRLLIGHSMRKSCFQLVLVTTGKLHRLILKSSLYKLTLVWIVTFHACTGTCTHVEYQLGKLEVVCSEQVDSLWNWLIPLSGLLGFDIATLPTSAVRVVSPTWCWGCPAGRRVKLFPHYQGRGQRSAAEQVVAAWPSFLLEIPFPPAKPNDTHTVHTHSIYIMR